MPDSPAARSRFIYSGGRMHALPSSALRMLTARPPIMAGAVAAILREPFVPRRRQNPSGINNSGGGGDEDDDESIYAFVARRLSDGLHPARHPHCPAALPVLNRGGLPLLSRTAHTGLAANLVDPLVRGIFAGDARRLSLQSCFPALHALEQSAGSLVLGALRPGSAAEPLPSAPPVPPSSDDARWMASMRVARLLGLRHGLEGITRALVRALAASPSVSMHGGERATALAQLPSGGIQVGGGAAREGAG